MRKIALLAVLNCCDAVGFVGEQQRRFQGFNGKAYFGSGVLSTGVGSSHFNVINGLGGKNIAGPSLGKIVFSTGKFTSGSLTRVAHSHRRFLHDLGNGKNGVPGGSFAGKFSGRHWKASISANLSLQP